MEQIYNIIYRNRKNRVLIVLHLSKNMLGLATQKPDISSFQSIEFHLSQNYINSQDNLSNRNRHQDGQYSNQPASLTYTMSHQEMKETINFDKENKQNFHLQSNLSRKTVLKVKQIQGKNAPNMKRKKSILNIRNLQLQIPQTAGTTVERQSRCIMRLKKQSSSKQRIQFSTSRKRISSNASNASIFSQVSSLKKNPSRDHKSFSENKVQICHLSTQDKSIIFQRQNSLDKIKESVDIKSSCVITRKIKSYSQNRSNFNRYNACMNLQTKRKSILRQNDKNIIDNLRAQNTILKKKQNCFLEDNSQDKKDLGLQVQSIKLEQNKAQSKLYLRKIIQCRVSVHHYAQTGRRYQ